MPIPQKFLNGRVSLQSLPSPYCCALLSISRSPSPPTAVSWALNHIQIPILFEGSWYLLLNLHFSHPQCIALGVWYPKLLSYLYFILQLLTAFFTTVSELYKHRSVGLRLQQQKLGHLCDFSSPLALSLYLYNSLPSGCVVWRREWVTVWADRSLLNSHRVWIA